MRAIFDIRYHWLTLAAVFAALGLGVLVGLSLAQGGYVTQEQHRLLAQLETQLNQLRNENRHLRQEGRAREQEMAALRRSVELLAAAAMRGRLQGREYVVLHDGSPAGRRWQTLLSGAGARVEEMSYGQLASPLDALRQDDLLARLILVNPPEGWPLEALEAAAVLWERPALPAARRGEIGEPAGGLRGLQVVADSGILSRWLLVEALHQGWKGTFDGASLASLPQRLEPLVEGWLP